MQSVATVTGLPLRGVSDGKGFRGIGGPEYSNHSQRPLTGFQTVSPDYFKTLGIEVVQGRAFTPQDTASGVRVALVNQEFVRGYLQGLDPPQQRIAIAEIIPGSPQLGPELNWQIVGVFHNVRNAPSAKTLLHSTFRSRNRPSPGVNLGVRTARNPGAMSRSIAAAVHLVDPLGAGTCAYHG